MRNFSYPDPSDPSYSVDASLSICPLAKNKVLLPAAGWWWYKLTEGNNGAGLGIFYQFDLPVTRLKSITSRPGHQSALRSARARLRRRRVSISFDEGRNPPSDCSSILATARMCGPCPVCVLAGYFKRHSVWKHKQNQRGRYLCCRGCWWGWCTVRWQRDSWFWLRLTISAAPLLKTCARYRSCDRWSGAGCTMVFRSNSFGPWAAENSMSQAAPLLRWRHHAGSPIDWPFIEDEWRTTLWRRMVWSRVVPYFSMHPSVDHGAHHAWRPRIGLASLVCFSSLTHAKSKYDMLISPTRGALMRKPWPMREGLPCLDWPPAIIDDGVFFDRVWSDAMPSPIAVMWSHGPNSSARYRCRHMEIPVYVMYYFLAKNRSAARARRWLHLSNSIEFR